MTTTSLVKPQLHNSVADSVYKEVSSRTARYYYFLGKALEWSDENNPPVPIDSFVYEKDTRKNIVLVKEILPSDVAFLVDRYDWTPGSVYDIYDDHYSSEVVGLNLVNGGINYSSNVTLTINGGGGSGATGNAVISDGAIVSVNLLSKGQNYTSKPNVIISDAYGTQANVQAVLNYAYSGASSLQNAKFYVVTDQFNIYKCLDNNYDSPSTVKPTELTPETFTTSDGYKWKFMGNIPISLKNRFLTPTTIPITTSVSSNFYSKGEIKSVNILDTGSGYTFGRIVVQGDGYLEDEPYVVVNVNVENSGNGYTSGNTTLTIDPPITATGAWLANTYYSVGKIISFKNNYYEVVLAGTTRAVGTPWTANTNYLKLDIVYNNNNLYEIANDGNSSIHPPTFEGGSQTLGEITYEYISPRNGIYGPEHTVGTEENGTVGFKFRGTQVTANANISGGEIVGITDLYGSVREIIITKGGSGYITAPTITLTGGGGSNASAYATIVDNTVRRIYITDSGKNYSSAPNVTIGTGWTANSTYALNDQIFYLTKLFTVTTAGTSNTLAPTHNSGSLLSGTAEFTFVGASATGYATLKYGAGYSFVPTARVSNINSVNVQAVVSVGAEKTEAYLTPYIDQGGRITRVNIENGGVGYTYATLTVVGDGSNAALQVNLSQGDLDSIQAISELQSVDGAIHTIKVVSQGYGYTQANVTITGDGSGASASATIIAGRITKINMISEGSGYTNAKVTIDGTGAGATARAILPPYGGHGKDTITELYARNLGFYSTINQETNQGYVVTNDYRQFGLIKDIRNYNNTKYFNNGTGSTCWLISGTVNTAVFTEDALVRKLSDNSAFTIISSTENGILVSSLDDTTPVIGDVMSVATGNSFVVTGITAPEVDKYSGELIFIDNRRAFTTTEDQSVSLKTVFRF